MTLDDKVATTVDNESIHVGKTDIEDARVVDKEAERRLCRKLDFHILPLLTLMYLFNALDKGNISNAKTDNIEKDLGILDSQWNLMLSIFYIPYVLCAFPLNTLVVKRYTAAVVLPILMIGFGGMSLIAAGVSNFGGLLTVRWFLGMFESCFFPGVLYYLSTFYRRTELARRISIFYAASSVANAFSGLLAFGVFQVNGSLHGWQYLFLIEGAATLITAIVAFIYLPRDVSRARFFNEEEKALAFHRIQTDASAIVGEGVSLRDAVKVLWSPVSAGWLVISLCLGVPLNSVNNWLPQIIQSLGKGTVKTNLYTVAPNLCGAVCLVALCFASDFSRMRSPYIIVAFSVTMLGFVVFGALDTQKNIGAAYFSCFLMTIGGPTTSVLLATWYSNNTPGETRRAVLSSVGVPLANAAGLISANIFLPKDAPKYVPALGITAAFCGVGLIMTIVLYVYMAMDNRRRNRAQGVEWTYRDVSTELMAEGPKNEFFRWIL